MNARPLRVRLVSKMEYPLATLFFVWERSRSNADIPPPKVIDSIMTPHKFSLADKIEATRLTEEFQEALTALNAPFKDGIFDLGVLRKRIWDTVFLILNEDIPCIENLWFVFDIDNISISLREQMVRHRIGNQIGQRLGVDIIPDLAESSFWAKTSRVISSGSYFEEGRYLLPESIVEKGCDDIYLQLLKEIENVYNAMVERGVPLEDARQVIPQATTSSLTWNINLKAMTHALSKRACQIAQSSLWDSVITGMVNELCDQVHPSFRKLILPPCLKKGSYGSCPYHQINRERIQGRDKFGPCSIYVFNETSTSISAYESSQADTGVEATWKPPTAPGTEGTVEEHAYPMPTAKDIRNWTSSKPREKEMLDARLERFERVWKLNVLTGEPLS